MMFQDVIDFLVEANQSQEKFDKVLRFYQLKDTIIHKQNFEDVCIQIALFFEQTFGSSGMKITTYDIEKSFEIELFSYKKPINNIYAPNILSYDFSKSYALNGRIFFLIEDKKQLQEIKEDRKYFDFILYELKVILLNYLAIKKIQDNSYIDEITSLPNRRFLIKHLSTLFAVAKKESLQMALLKVEIDRFKAIMEEFDYDIANQVLKKLAQVLQKNSTKTDIVTKFIGSSFVVCMEDIDSKDTIEQFAKNVIEQFAKEFVIVDVATSQKLFKTICIGIVVYPEDGEHFDILLKNCDIALDEAKNKGRSSYEFYTNKQHGMVDLF